MSPLVAALLVLTLFIVSGYFGWQQVQTLGGLRRIQSLSREDYLYFRNQAWRRLLGCTLMVAIGALISWWFLSGLIDRIDAIGEAKLAQPQGAKQPLDPEQRRTALAFSYTVIGALTLLMLVLFVAAWDVWAIRRYGARHYRRIQEDRRAMIQRQLVQLRKERGHRRNGPSNN